MNDHSSPEHEGIGQVAEEALKWQTNLREWSLSSRLIGGRSHRRKRERLDIRQAIASVRLAEKKEKEKEKSKGKQRPQLHGTYSTEGKTPVFDSDKSRHYQQERRSRSAGPEHRLPHHRRESMKEKDRRGRLIDSTSRDGADDRDSLTLRVLLTEITDLMKRNAALEHQLAVVTAKYDVQMRSKLTTSPSADMKSTDSSRLLAHMWEILGDMRLALDLSTHSSTSKLQQCQSENKRLRKLMQKLLDERGQWKKLNLPLVPPDEAVERALPSVRRGQAEPGLPHLTAASNLPFSLSFSFDSDGGEELWGGLSHPNEDNHSFGEDAPNLRVERAGNWVPSPPVMQGAPFPQSPSPR